MALFNLATDGTDDLVLDILYTIHIRIQMIQLHRFLSFEAFSATHSFI